jgi:FdhD protein
LAEVERVSILRFSEDEKKLIDDIVVREFPLTIILNNQELVTLLCTPIHLDYLAVGFLSSEGLLKSKDEINKITVDEKRGVVRIETKEETKDAGELVFKRMITSGCGRGASFYSAADAMGQKKVESKTSILATEVFELVREFQHRSQTFRTTGGVHSAALCDTEKILIFSEDIGRHNAIDKIFGECILKEIPADERVILTSGRVSSEILLKTARRNIPVLISKSAPTDMGVKLAGDLGITLIGFVRGKRMNVYANDWRIVGHG